MESQGIFSRTFPLLEKVLDLRSVKHSYIASNIANMDTPNYKAFDLIVEKELKKAMSRESSIELSMTQPAHISGRRTYQDSVDGKKTGGFSLRNDGNSVDIDKEMASLAENNLLYNTIAQILAKKFQGLKNVIQEGRR
ncbi:MAG: flagellar basal body rod protein FlgB [Thermodesulfobacteriota bacterium]|nr:flagellar basal body rod protein FlgB [Thermodesulfobacteriota bacterium]